MSIDGPGAWHGGGEKASWIKIVTGHIIIGIATLTIGIHPQDFFYFRGGTGTLSL